MEDLNTFASECIVISCCCQCLMLQILVFVLLKVPNKLVKKTKKYANKKLSRRKRKKTMVERQTSQYKEEFLDFHGGSTLRVQVESFGIKGWDGDGCCLDEVEKVLEELFQKGEFAFGSFWGKEEPGGLSTSVAKQDIKNSVVQNHFIEMVSPITVGYI